MADLKSRLLAIGSAIIVTTYAIWMVSLFTNDMLGKIYLLCCAILCIGIFMSITIYLKLKDKEKVIKKIDKKTNKLYEFLTSGIGAVIIYIIAIFCAVLLKGIIGATGVVILLFVVLLVLVGVGEQYRNKRKLRSTKLTKKRKKK